jgi:hypothetical protein
MNIRSTFAAFCLFTVAVAVPLLMPTPASAWHVDTNATTDTTDYVPLKPTDILIGKVGNTGTIWVAGAKADTNSWINLTGALGLNSINSGNINDGTITNDDIAAGANIAASKLNLAGPTLGTLTVQTNATVAGTLGVTGIVTMGATQTVFSAAAAAAPTNLVAGAGVGINVRINGTNYLLHAKPN